MIYLYSLQHHSPSSLSLISAKINRLFSLVCKKYDKEYDVVGVLGHTLDICTSLRRYSIHGAIFDAASLFDCFVTAEVGDSRCCYAGSLCVGTFVANQKHHNIVFFRPSENTKEYVPHSNF